MLVSELMEGRMEKSSSMIGNALNDLEKLRLKISLDSSRPVRAIPTPN